MTKQTSKQYLEHTHAGKELLKKYDLRELATWEVKGEDPNCDFGGQHFSPTLGYFTGKLEDIVELAVNLPNFWTWGGGGRIIRINSMSVTNATVAHHKALRKEREDLQARLKEINLELGEKS